jgi:TatD DNase family protein
MELIDTHTHLDGFARRGELPGVLDRAKAAGVAAMIASGTEPGDWALYRDLARDHPGVVHYAAGLHPCSVAPGWEEALAQAEGFFTGAAPRPVALGEVGLDRFHLPKDAGAAERIFGAQRAAFAAGLQQAKRLGVPVVVHSRGAFRECVELIDASGADWSRVVFHCFSEGPGEMDVLRQRGGRGSFTGIITYKNADAVRVAAQRQGLARLMVETDAPYLAPVPHRGATNEPAFVRHTAEFCAGLFGVSVEELAAVTTANAKAFFGIGPWISRMRLAAPKAIRVIRGQRPTPRRTSARKAAPARPASAGRRRPWRRSARSSPCRPPAS